MNKYTHVKESTKQLRREQERALNIKRVANHKTVERLFGFFFPSFGSSLGVSYDGANGFITKTNRAQSVL